MGRPSPELVACMLAAHDDFACQATDCLSELADADDDEIRRAVPALAASVCDEAIARAGLALSDSERQWMTEHVLHEAFGSGPLEPLLRDADSDAIVILGPRDVFLERDGELRETAVVFADDQHILRVFERREGFERYLERVPGEGGPTWRIDLRKVRQRMAEMASSEAVAASTANVANPVAPRQSGGFVQWLAKLFG